jgi:hypothetical protein
MTTVCAECNGDSAENLVGNPIQCEACQDTGRLHEDCGQCGERFEFESGSGDVCADCIEKARPKERDWDALIDQRRGK